MKYQDQPLQVALALKEQARKTWLAKVFANGWSFGYNQPGGITPGMFGFSAMLQPECRSSTIEDWQYLGAVMGAVGVPLPEGPSRFVYYTDAATADPNSVLKWLWKEKL